MISLLGRGLILAALAAATTGSIVALLSGRWQDRKLYTQARILTWIMVAALTAANVAMVVALLIPDFSVHYVSQVGSRAAPLWIKVVSLWSSLEGSILFWGLILAGYVGWMDLTWGDPDRLRDTGGVKASPHPYGLAAVLAVSVFFCFLIAGPANPFELVDPAPLDGPGPNPLLQNHILMIVHPPLLYLGYVGMMIPFGMAVGALARGHIGPSWLKPMRRALLIPWIFLTAGIVLGGWWAYEVLGWGGYWAWDPVENASFLPWLTATAALHSIIVQERKGVLKGWTTILIMASFLLTLLGTFMTRSGIFNSVHSFTQSNIGPTFLVFIAIVLVFCVILLSLRIDLLAPDQELETGATREWFFLVQNFLFVSFTFVVLIGTVFPLVAEAFAGQQLSVGAPYFNRLSIPIGLIILLVMGVGPAIPWGGANREQLTRRLLAPLGLGFVFVAVFAAVGWRGPMVLLTGFLGGYTTAVSLSEGWAPVAARLGRGDALPVALIGAWRRARRRIGAYVAHIAVVVMVLAIAVSSGYQTKVDAPLNPGQSMQIGEYELVFQGVRQVQEPHRQRTMATVEVLRDGRALTTLEPAMNHYQTQRQPISTPSVRTGLSEDLYLTIRSVDTANNQVVLRAFVTPLVGWLWAGAALMVVGSLMAAWPRSKRAVMAAAQQVASSAEAPAEGAA